MPEFHFVCSPGEELALIKELMDEGWGVIQENGLRTRVPTPVKSVEHYEKLRTERYIVSWILTNPEYTILPLKVGYISSGHYQGYAITPNWGGPTIQFAAGPFMFAKPESKKLGIAMLHHYPHYWNWRDGRPIDTFEPSEELRRCFKQLVKWIKSVSKCYKLVGRRTWVGPEAESLLRAGWSISKPEADRDYREQSGVS